MSGVNAFLWLRLSYLPLALMISGLVVLPGCQDPVPPAAAPQATNSGTQTKPVTTKDAPDQKPEFKFQPRSKTDPKLSKTGADTPLDLQIQLTDVARKSGLDFTYLNGGTGKLLMVESMGGGAGWLDYDRDRRWDLYLCQGGDPAGENRPPGALFRQASHSQFVNVIASARADDPGYGQGVAVGDFDNDGFDDVYVTNVNGNVLLQNLGDGTFVDVTVAAGVTDGRWSTSAAWGDIDRDGDLDLYVCNYLQYDPRKPFPCEKDGRPALCHPRQLEHWPDELYENQGDGTFRPIARAKGIYGPGNKGLGIVIGDLTNDGLPDLYVANDTTPNFLFVQGPAGKFMERALELGVAISGQGDAQASMGIGVADFDGNGWLDLLLTHFTGEYNTLYQNEGERGFRDATIPLGVRNMTLPKLGFGTAFIDLNEDGAYECLTTNGHIDSNNADGEGYEQRPQLMTFQRNRWHEISSVAGQFFEQKLVGRGLAVADFDTDGRMDVCIVHQNTPTALLRNESVAAGSWLNVEFIGRRSNRRGIGCRARLHLPEGERMCELVGGSSYCVSHQPLLHFGIPGNPPQKSVRLEIRWPSGTIQNLEVTELNQTLTVVEPTTPSAF